MIQSELLQAVNRLASSACGLLALDRDGTLVPYAARPEQAVVDGELSELLSEFAAVPQLAVAIVSARSVAQLQGDFGQAHLTLAGNYGLEVLYPGRELAVHPQALAAVSQLKKARDEIAELVGLNAGAILEDHGYSLCLHFQQVSPGKRPLIHQALLRLSGMFPTLKFRRLPTSWEVLPDLRWDKGLAIGSIDAYWRAEWAQAGESEPFYFYAGDSEADTPAFQWVSEHAGISVRIGGEEALGADFHLGAPSDLRNILRLILQVRLQQQAA